ncbi:MAG: hypothetical protein JRI58_11710 [Deltaproteobacteria bacterium]|nr:hypothetical protein [Deltaproteobacteria bacterium]
MWVILVLLYPYGMVHGEISDDTTWKSIETKHTIIQYQTLEDLKKFNKKVAYYSLGWGLKSLFSGSGSDNMADKLKKKVDALYRRVQEILDMRKKIEKVIINIYHDKKQLHAAYYKIFKKKCPSRAWYIYEYNTIYINADDLHERMLAHEMAHAIIDHYFAVRPPTATAEILARYVDKHLLD